MDNLEKILESYNRNVQPSYLAELVQIIDSFEAVEIRF